MWQLLCMTAHESQQIFYHEWIGFKKKKSPNKVQKLLEVLYPDKKVDEIELLAELTTISDAKKLAQDYGYDDKQITKILG